MEEIQRLVQDRENQATKRQISPKLMTVARSLGQSVFGDMGFGSGLGGSPYDPEAWMSDEEKGEDLPTAGDGDPSDMGLIYDALNIGHNFEIRYMKHDKQVRAKYDGRIVFLEEEGKIKAYVPNPVWEELLDRIYAKAKPVEETRKIKEKQESKEGFVKQANKFLKELRESWGF